MILSHILLQHSFHFMEKLPQARDNNLFQLLLHFTDEMLLSLADFIHTVNLIQHMSFQDTKRLYIKLNTLRKDIYCILNVYCRHLKIDQYHYLKKSIE
jgi:hypothetical protein